MDRMGYFAYWIVQPEITSVELDLQFRELGLLSWMQMLRFVMIVMVILNQCEESKKARKK